MLRYPTCEELFRHFLKFSIAIKRLMLTGTLLQHFCWELKCDLEHFAPLVPPTPNPVWVGVWSKLFLLLQKLGKDIIDDGADDCPVSILVVMDQPVSQTGNFYPRDGAVLIFKLWR